MSSTHSLSQSMGIKAYENMGIKPGEQMMRQLEQMTEEISGGFNSQSVANTLWVFPKMETKPGDRTME